MFSTHDWTVSSAGPEPVVFNEAWADVKMPGGFPTTAVAFPAGIAPTADNRNTYVTGTIEVNSTFAGSQFSNAPASAPAGILPFNLPATRRRQVAMLQVNDSVNANNTQLYFYGSTPNESERATNARGISVWRTGVDATDRIAICGETYDEVLPLSQAAAGWPSANATNPSGFIAVFDGTGALQWSHHFFDAANGGSESCAITDVSIRVDAEGNDIVTYCGISTHGQPAGGELAALLPFPSVGPCNGGGSPLPAGQWDGIVGRVIANGAGTSARLFHSNVGGLGQDGLFGIAEIDENRFVVVGSSESGAVASGYPSPTLCGVTGPFVVGTMLAFDAAPTLSLLPLAPPRGQDFGTRSPHVHTMARDVHIGRNTFVGAGLSNNLIYCVGSTDDPNFTSGTGVFFVAPPGPPSTSATLSGPTDGFLVACLDDAALSPWTFAYHGDDGDDGLTGINGWSEFSEHVTVTGFSQTPAGDLNIDVASYFFNIAIGVDTAGNTGPPNGTLQLLQVRRTQFGGTNEDRPAVMGQTSATTTALAWQQFGLGQESGGGVAVGPNGRANAVGRTAPSGGYPTAGVGSRLSDQGFDAVRSEVDLVPPGAVGVGRTDGTGFQALVPGVFPPLPASGFTGGTTPFCALSPFGIQIGQPLPNLQRMLIDFEGNLAPGSTDVAIIITRPTTQVGTIATGVLQLGFPPAAPWVYLTGTEFWLGGGIYTAYPAIGPNQPFRMQMVPLPLGGGTVSAQLVCLLSTPVTGPAAGCSSTWSASPAMWFSW